MRGRQEADQRITRWRGYSCQVLSIRIYALRVHAIFRGVNGLAHQNSCRGLFCGFLEEVSIKGWNDVGAVRLSSVGARRKRCRLPRSLRLLTPSKHIKTRGVCCCLSVRYNRRHRDTALNLDEQETATR